MKRLEALQDAGAVDEFMKCAVTYMAKDVAPHLAGKDEKIKEGVESIMGGKSLNYDKNSPRRQTSRVLCS